MAILDKSIPLEVNNQFLWIIKRTQEEIIGKDLIAVCL